MIYSVSNNNIFKLGTSCLFLFFWLWFPFVCSVKRSLPLGFQLTCRAGFTLRKGDYTVFKQGAIIRASCPKAKWEGVVTVSLEPPRMP